MKHIVMFSGGASSSVMAEMVVKEHGRENTVLLFTPTYAEHKDADRFRHQVANKLEMPITVVADGRDLWTVNSYKRSAWPLYFFGTFLNV